MRGSPSRRSAAVSFAAGMSTVSSAALNVDHDVPPAVTPFSRPAHADGARSRSRTPPSGGDAANDGGSVTFAWTSKAAPSAGATARSVYVTRPYRVVRFAATIGASPAASQPRGVAFASHSVRVSGSSKQSIHFR